MTLHNPPLLLPGPIQPPAKRRFVYDGQMFEDPGPRYSIREVLAFLSETYPELSSGSWTSRSRPDGSEEITLVKVSGEKGAGTLSARHLADRLAELQPTPIQAIRITDRLWAAAEQDALDAETVMEFQPEIEAALKQAEAISIYSQRILQRCLSLTPIPHPKVPLGF